MAIYPSRPYNVKPLTSPLFVANVTNTLFEALLTFLIVLPISSHNSRQTGNGKSGNGWIQLHQRTEKPVAHIEKTHSVAIAQSSLDYGKVLNER